MEEEHLKVVVMEAVVVETRWMIVHLLLVFLD
jgi:hypothetical protein